MKKIFLKELAEKLALPENAVKYFSSHWEMLCENIGELPEKPENFTWEFYEKRKAYFKSSIAKDLLERIRQILPVLEKFPECWFLAKAYEYMDYKVVTPFPSGELVQNIPVFGENTAVFCWMVKAGLIPYLRNLYRKESIPLQMAEDHLATHIGVAEMHTKKNNGIPGCTLSVASWDRQYAQRKLFRIGRLVYRPEECSWYLPYIYRHKVTKKLAVFAREGWLLNEKSQMPYLREEAKGFTRIRFREEGGMISGYAIDPYGKCDLSAPVTLPAEEWENLLPNSALIGDMHIPAGEPFSPELILDSMVRANEFLESYFGRKITIFSCQSWLLNPAWEELIPRSNIAKFQKEGYLFPGDCCDIEGLGNVFGRTDGDRLAYPRTNSLENAFHTLLLAGERLRAGGIFFLPEFLKYYGTSFYRK